MELEKEALKFHAQMQAAKDQALLEIPEVLKKILREMEAHRQEMKRINDFVIDGRIVSVDQDTARLGPEPVVEPTSGTDVGPEGEEVFFGAEKVIRQIMEARPQLPREYIERLIDEEQARTAGLLTTEAAAYLVASNLGILKDEEEAPPTGPPLPENLKEEADVIAFYKNVLSNARSRDGEPLPSEVVEGTVITVEEDKVTLKTPFMRGWEGKMYFAVVGEALREYGGKWTSVDEQGNKLGGDSHWLLPKP